MKRFLCAGVKYAIFVLFLLVPILTLFAQESNVQITRITAGEKLPEEFWTTEFQFFDHNKVYHTTLQQFRGKPIILDFWATTCAKCFEGFPFLKEMQSKYTGRINIILVNTWYKDNQDAIENRFTNFDDNYRLPSIIQDKFLKSLFPHNAIPYYIWISSIGRVYAISTKSLVTEENLLKLMQQYENQ